MWDVLAVAVEDAMDAPPGHLILESILLLSVIYLLFFTKSYKRDPRGPRLTKREQEQLLDEWVPEPLAPPVKGPLPKPPVADGHVGTRVSIEGAEKINMSSFNFLGLVGSSEVESAAVAAVRRYGVGSCGPRGFYGTIDCHLSLESELAKFMGTEMAVMYSFGFSTIASVIPAYAKRGDVIFWDAGCNFAIQKGLVASRSQLRMFAHNDVADLRRLLEAQALEDERDPVKARATRRFLVVEGLYTNAGDMAPLRELVELKYKYKFRIVMDESCSFGALGATGRGLTEELGVPVDEVDMITANLGNALASIGGFCCGREYVIDHQVLSAQGYCFSASLPPMLAVAASKALAILDSEAGKERLASLKAHTRTAQRALRALSGIEVAGSPDSQVIHVRLKPSAEAEEENVAVQEETLRKVAAVALEKGVAVSVAAYIREEEENPPPPSLRVCVSAGHTKDEIETAMGVLKACFAQVLSS